MTAETIEAAISQDDLGGTLRFKVPAELLPIPDATGLAGLLLVRPFRKPTGLTTGSRISLELQAADGLRQVWLNGVCLRDLIEDQSQVTLPLSLEQQNRLGLVVDHACLEQTGQPPLQGVALVIEEEDQ